jgi:NitT/TauT family transport system permease protein
MSGRLGRVLAPVVVGVALLGAWEAAVAIFDIEPYVLPAPSDIWRELGDNRSQIVEAGRASGANALVGLALGSVVAIGAALLAIRLRVVEEIVTPLAAAAAALPIIALAPVLNNMFSTTSTVPRRIVVAIVVFAPVFVNTLRGLGTVDPVHRELLRSCGAGDGALLRKVRVPGALPFAVTGLKVASSLSVIAAVVAEYFGGLQDGLGSRITSAASNTAYGRAWAYVVASCVLGLAFYLVAAGLERAASPTRSTFGRRRPATIRSTMTNQGGLGT